MGIRSLICCALLLCVCGGAVSQVPTIASLSISAAGTPVTASREGTVITLAATVTTASGAATPPGQVIFCEVKPAPLQCTDIRLIGLAQLLPSGTATYKFMPGPGTHMYQARFLGTHVEAASVSSAIPLSVIAYPPTITGIAATGSPGNYTLTATVTTTGGTTPPTGSVIFQDTDNANYPLATVGTLIPGASAPGLGFAYSSPEFAGPGAAVVTGDFNADGKLDMAVVANPFLPSLSSIADEQNAVTQNTMTVFFGNGDGTFTRGPTSNIGPLGAFCVGLAGADLNGDGSQDLALSFVSYSSNKPGLQILLGKGDGTFTAGQAIPTTAQLSPIIGDFNRDGIPDLAYVDLLPGPQQQYGLYTLLGNGDGTFVAKLSTPVIGVSAYAAVGDFNRDGNSDIIIGYQGSNSISVMLGKGDGTFAASTVNSVTSSTTYLVTAADFNGDGVLDLAVSNDQVGLPAEMAILRGNGDGTFASPNAVPAPSATAYSGLAVADFNGDGIADLGFGALTSAVTNGKVTTVQSIDLMLGNGDGTFAIAKQFPSSSYIGVLTAADFNGDGLSDLLVENTSAQLGTLLSTLGSETFAATAAATNISIVGTGTHQIDAAYSGDASYQPSNSASIGLTAEPVQTTLALTASPAATSYGQQVTLAATLAPSTPQQNHLPTGTVTFSTGATLVGTAPVAGGAVVFNTATLPSGSDSIVATYSGDANFTASTSGTATEVVSGYSSTTTLTSSANPAGLGQPVTFTATVTGSGLTQTPTGSVAFFDGTTQIGSATLNASGQASLTTATLALGSHPITAAYSGDTIFHPSTSPVATETIIPSDFNLTLASPTISLQTYQRTTTAITLTSLGAFSDTLTLACGNPPQYLTCVFTPQPATLTANSTATVSFYIDTDAILGGSARNETKTGLRTGHKSLLASLAFLLGLWLTPVRRRTLRLCLLLAACTLPLTLSLTGCGGNQISPVPHAAPGTYTIPITATASTTHLTHTTNLTLTITP